MAMIATTTNNSIAVNPWVSRRLSCVTSKADIALSAGWVQGHNRRTYRSANQIVAEGFSLFLECRGTTRFPGAFRVSTMARHAGSLLVGPVLLSELGESFSFLVFGQAIVGHDQGWKTLAA